MLEVPKMIRIFYGDDRATISAKIKREFGEDYEVFDGENLKFEDLPSKIGRAHV